MSSNPPDDNNPTMVSSSASEENGVSPYSFFSPPAEERVPSGPTMMPSPAIGEDVENPTWDPNEDESDDSPVLNDSMPTTTSSSIIEGDVDDEESDDFPTREVGSQTVPSVSAVEEDVQGSSPPSSYVTEEDVKGSYQIVDDDEVENIPFYLSAVFPVQGCVDPPIPECKPNKRYTGSDLDPSIPEHCREAFETDFPNADFVSLDTKTEAQRCGLWAFQNSLLALQQRNPAVPVPTYADLWKSRTEYALVELQNSVEGIPQEVLGDEYAPGKMLVDWFTAEELWLIVKGWAVHHHGLDREFWGGIQLGFVIPKTEFNTLPLSLHFEVEIFDVPENGEPDLPILRVWILHNGQVHWEGIDRVSEATANLPRAGTEIIQSKGADAATQPGQRVWQFSMPNRNVVPVSQESFSFGNLGNQSLLSPPSPFPNHSQIHNLLTATFELDCYPLQPIETYHASLPTPLSFPYLYRAENIAFQLDLHASLTYVQPDFNEVADESIPLSILPRLRPSLPLTTTYHHEPNTSGLESLSYAAEFHQLRQTAPPHLQQPQPQQPQPQQPQPQQPQPQQPQPQQPQPQQPQPQQPQPPRDCQQGQEVYPTPKSYLMHDRPSTPGMEPPPAKRRATGRLSRRGDDPDSDEEEKEEEEEEDEKDEKYNEDDKDDDEDPDEEESEDDTDSDEDDEDDEDETDEEDNDENPDLQEGGNNPDPDEKEKEDHADPDEEDTDLEPPPPKRRCTSRRLWVRGGDTNLDQETVNEELRNIRIRKILMKEI